MCQKAQSTKGSVNDEVHGSEDYCQLGCDAVQYVTTNSGLLLYREVIVYFENYSKHIKKLCG